MTEPDMCQVEESQVQGPHVIRETEYTPASASGPVGEAGSRSAAVEPTFPRPEPAMYAEHSRYEGPRTAPATRVRFTEDLGEEGAVSVLFVCCHRDQNRRDSTQNIL